jgi:hypothetical protein
VGDVRLFENADPGQHVVGAHKGAQQRLVGIFVLVADLANRFGDAGDVGHRLRRQNDQHLIHCFVGEYRPHRSRIAVFAGVADHVHRVLEVGGFGQRVAQFRGGILGETREFETFADGCVGRHHARTARIGDDGDAVAARQRLVGEQLRGVEHVVDRTATDDPGLFEHPVAHVGTGGQRTGVGLGSRGTGCGSPALDGQNRLGIIWIARDRPRRLHQFAPAGDALQVHENDRGFGIVRQVVQQVHLVHVGLVAQLMNLLKPMFLPSA